MSAKDKLDKIYKQYESLIIICESAKRNVKYGNSSQLDIIVFKKEKKIRDKNIFIDDYFDSLKIKITELYTLDIIATFEQILFDIIDNTSGEIKSIVKNEYNRRYQKKDKPIRLYKSAASFIKNKEDIHNLSGAKKILENVIKDKLLFEDLKKIIEHRNWLSHGKRFDIGKESTFKINEIHNKLIKMLEIIKEE